MVKENFFSKSIRSVFVLDLRAIALLRIALSLVLMADLFFRASDLKAFYTGQGILPLQVLHQYLWNNSYFSIFTTNDNFYLQSILFAVNFFCVFCLLIGYRTKLFTILSWLFLLSIHNRNPLILQAGDHLLRLMVFWGIFLPWGYLYSLDSLKNIRINRTYSFESFAGFAYICQIAFLYFFAALIKSSPEWQSAYTAIYYALSIDQMVTPIGKIIYPYFGLLKVLTALVYHVELLLPLMLFMPFYNSRFRMVIIITIALLQVGIYSTLNVGLFSITSVVVMIGLLPTSFLNSFYTRYFRPIDVFLAFGNRLRSANFSLKFKQTVALPKPQIFSEIVVSLALLYVLGWNMHTVGKKVIPDNFLWIGRLFKLHQHWGMFAPAVFKDDGWFIYLGTTTDGRKIDLLRNGKPLDYEKPERVTDLVKNDRWRKYGENMIMNKNSHLRPYFCEFLIEQWNATKRDSFVTDLKVIYLHERTLPGYRTQEVEPWNICNCAAKPEEATSNQKTPE